MQSNICNSITKLRKSIINTFSNKNLNIKGQFLNVLKLGQDFCFDLFLNNKEWIVFKSISKIITMNIYF